MDLPSGWEWSAIEDLTSNDRHSLAIGPFGSNLKVVDYRDNGVPLVFVRHIRAREFEGLDPRFVDEAKALELAAHTVRAGDVLVTKMGEPPGDACVYPDRPQAVLTADCIKVTPQASINAKYLAYLIEAPQFRGTMRTITQGVAQRKVSLGRFRKLQVPVAPRAEQQRIATAIEEYFSRLDAAEGSLETAAAKAHLLTRATVAHLFDDADWPWTTLGEIAQVNGGVTKDAKRQGDPSFVELPYLRVANVQRGWLDLREITTIRVAPEKGEALRLLPGDVLFNEGGDRDKLGRGWVWEGQIGHCIHQNHVFRARLTTDAFDPYFVSTHANTWGQAWFEKHGRQTTNLASINKTTLMQFPVPAPPIAEQAAIVAELQRNAEVRDRLIAEVERSQRRVSALRSSILAAAFSGQLVPQDLSEEQASALLDRIREERRSGASPSARRTTAAAT